MCGVFVLRVKLTKTRAAVVALLIAAVILLIIGAVTAKEPNPVQNGATDEMRIAFLHHYGWQVSEKPVETLTIRIPSEFNDVYDAYNQIQIEQKTDLKPYCGLEVMRYTYQVTNYPGRDDVRANLLVYNDRIIGGDISTTALDGFMSGFDSYPSEK